MTEFLLHNTFVFPDTVHVTIPALHLFLSTCNHFPYTYPYLHDYRMRLSISDRFNVIAEVIMVGTQ